MDDTKKQTTVTTTKPSTVDLSGDSRLVVIDLGKKQSGKKIRRLRQGQGPLMDDIKDLVAKTKENLGVKESTIPIVVVVQKKRRNNGMFW
ncbi:MAG TPA: hypothetical protein VFA20_26805 [Myxococcaceae bacterium]|nr:hypothetical protein [Myxococcaceae bacterium]